MRQDLVARLGAVITLKVAGVGAGADFRDELRNSNGRPIRGFASMGNGVVRYEGLSPGTYVFVGATEKRYVTKRIVVREFKQYDVGRLCDDAQDIDPVRNDGTERSRRGDDRQPVPA